MWILSSSEGKLKETPKALIPGAYILGRSVRDDSSNIQIVSKSVSKKHVQITVSPPKATSHRNENPCGIDIQDLDTKFGTAVNNERIHAKQSYEKNVSLQLSLGKCPLKLYLQWINLSIAFDDQETKARWSTPLLLTGIPNSVHLNHSTTHFVPGKGPLLSVKTALAFLKDIIIVQESFVEALVQEKDNYSKNIHLIPKDSSYLFTGKNHHELFSKSPGIFRNMLKGLKCCCIDLDAELPEFLSLLGLDVHRHHTDDVQFLTTYYTERDLDFMILVKQKTTSSILLEENVFCLTFSELWNILKESNPKELLRAKRTSHKKSKPNATSIPVPNTSSGNVLDDLFSNFKPVPRSPRSKRTLKPEEMPDVSKQTPSNSPLKKKVRDTVEATKKPNVTSDTSSSYVSSKAKKLFHENFPEHENSSKKAVKKNTNDSKKLGSSHFAPLPLSTAGEENPLHGKIKEERDTSPLTLKGEQTKPPDAPSPEENLPRNLGSVEFISIQVSKNNGTNEPENPKYQGRPNFKKFRKQGSKVHVAPPVFITLSESRNERDDEVIDIDTDPAPQLMKKTDTSTRSVPSPKPVSQRLTMDMDKDEQNVADDIFNDDNEEDDEFGDLKFRF
ncbi:Mre11 complex BRCT domain subunit Nbs1 [Schizosaccharomyces osmophilus]|uniref:Mre11 complex BRCT domain subunit Nbs1 n=1 Tax=Schizosaccharomyces osmophilus TaxID=2545709 RepID=A0AAE9W938_9SCHI|nr:Mre11 complex BRCT domain subunit Nbs1 [Schizosaccharomyces osmophilus]WBW71454.1 Mre11 complex BRCT domain subunit Nbs1 [Schizosaccharomyces osmophilus]